jgi:hypothetical protein
LQYFLQIILAILILIFLILFAVLLEAVLVPEVHPPLPARHPAPLHIIMAVAVHIRLGEVMAVESAVC